MCNEFCFHPIGQGLFYTGRVGDFTFVYDCGATGKIKQRKSVINQAKGDIWREGDNANKSLDMLIISHFHEDHINGVEHLISDIKVNEVVLPYLYPEERLIAGAEYAIKNRLDTLSPDYIRFLVDPVAYLRGEEDADVPAVTFILPDDPVEKWEIPGNAEGEWMGERVPDDRVPRDLLLNGKPRTGITFREHSTLYRPKTRGLEWQFKFYCRSRDDRRSCIREEMENTKITLDNGTSTTLAELLDSPDGVSVILKRCLAGLKDAYRRAFGKRRGGNSISLICCHGPVGHANQCARIISVPRQNPRWEILFLGFTQPSARFQMLTGDADIDVSEFNKHFTPELDHVSVCLVPHHGAKANWKDELLHAMKNCNLWVASFGMGNSYGHPKKKVLKSLARAGKLFLPCHECRGWRVSIW